jgi:flagellin-like hook-associated protein FlgL
LADLPDVVGNINNDVLLKATNVWMRHSADVERSMERLATGKRINRASDDPAGSVAVTEFNGQLESLNAKRKGVQQQRYYTAAREGGNAAINDLVIELKGLVVQAGNTGALSDTERRTIQDQIDSKIEAIDFMSNTFTYKGERVFSSALSTSLGVVLREIDAPDPNDPTKTIKQKETLNLRSLKSGGALNTLTGDLTLAEQAVDAAVHQNSTEQAFLGVQQRDYDAKERAIQMEIENITGAKSQIEDTDYASEVANLVKRQVLQQASMFMIQTDMEQVKQITSLIAAVAPGGAASVTPGRTLNTVG